MEMELNELLARKSCTLGFRVPILLAAKIEKTAREKGSNVSRLTVELWQRELGVDSSGVSRESQE